MNQNDRPYLQQLGRSELASYILAVAALFVVLKFGLLIALFSGLLVYSLVHMLAPAIQRKWSSYQSRVLVVALLSTTIIALITAAIWAAIVYLRSDAGNLHNLLQKLADIIEASRAQMPDWLLANMPGDVDDLRGMLSGWLREHAGEAKSLGQEAMRVLVHLILGMVIGSMVALQDAVAPGSYKPFALALRNRVASLADIFQKIVFAQVRISLINTSFVAVYLMLVLPASGVHLPLSKSMVAITFVAGLIPVAGNLISNTVLVIVGLSHSVQVAAASLLFMIVIHKLEYFLNAKIVGSRVNARAWELLIAILVMETVFGVPGVVAAPVFYAYLKKELSDRDLV